MIRPGRSSFDPSDKVQLKLSKKEQAAIASLNAEVETALRKKLEVIRVSARRQGITAEKLEDLKSESGRPFMEETRGSRSLSHEDYKRAVVKEEIQEGVLAGKSMITEVAYLCLSSFLFGANQENSDSCGWVKGSPVPQKYDDIGPLSGSAGIKYYCKICGHLIGVEKHIIS